MSATTISVSMGSVMFDAPITEVVYQNAIRQELGPSGDVDVTVNATDTLVGYQLGGAEVQAPLRTPFVPDTGVFCPKNCGGTPVGYMIVLPPTPPAVTPEPEVLSLIVIVLAFFALLRGIQAWLRGSKE